MSRPRRAIHWKRSAAFTLVELLAVLAIVAILLALGGTAASELSGRIRSYQLEGASQIVTSQLVLARQNALSSSHAVQVRFYYLPDTNQAATAPPMVFRGMQCFTEGDPPATGNPLLVALTKPMLFPGSVIALTTTPPNASPLLGPTPKTPAATDAQVSSFGPNYQYVSFHYQPDGSTDLATGATSVTLVIETDPRQNASGLPNDFRTIQIDPVIGRVRTFRP